jgi:hypothetical protein
MPFGKSKHPTCGFIGLEQPSRASIDGDSAIPKSCEGLMRTDLAQLFWILDGDPHIRILLRLTLDEAIASRLPRSNFVCEIVENKIAAVGSNITVRMAWP